MTDASAAAESSRFAANPTDVVNRILTGHISGATALGPGLVVGTVAAIDGDYCVVDIGLGQQPGQAVWHCYWEPRYKPPSSIPMTPPVGTVCVIAVPTTVDQFDDRTAWVVAFKGWPA